MGMTTAGKIAVISVLLGPLAGCMHKANVVPPPKEQAPVPPLSRMVHLPALPELPPSPSPNVVLAAKEETPPPPAPRPHKNTHRKPAKNTTETAANPASASEKAAQQQQADLTPPVETSPIGQLSSTGNSDPQGRRSLEQQITATEKGLANINRPLDTEEQATSSQIKTFLQKARQALAVDDLEGAQTLTTKAKVLLAELTRK